MSYKSLDPKVLEALSEASNEAPQERLNKRILLKQCRDQIIALLARGFSRKGIARRISTENFRVSSDDIRAIVGPSRKRNNKSKAKKETPRAIVGGWAATAADAQAGSKSENVANASPGSKPDTKPETGTKPGTKASADSKPATATQNITQPIAQTSATPAAPSTALIQKVAATQRTA